MDLIAVVKQKNDQLLVQNILLQQHLCTRVSTPQFRSFLTTFIIAPFIVGAVAQFALGHKPTMSRHLVRAILPGFKFWPFF